MAQTQEKGMSIFLDVFRRADKNDDGALSWEEFKSFFADGVLSEEELRKLFLDIDTHKSGNIDTGELCTYFSKHLGAFKEIFGAVEDLNASVSKSLHASAEDYPKSDQEQKFIIRFLLREFLNQLCALQRPIDAASDYLDEKAQAESLSSADKVAKPGTPQAAVDEPGFTQVLDAGGKLTTATSGSITPGRFARRARRQLSTQTSWTVESGGAAGSLVQQVDRLRSLVDKLENKVNLSGGVEEQVDIKDEKLLKLVQRHMQVTEENSKAFRNSLRHYVEYTNSNEACMHLSVRSYVGSPVFMIYEVWETDEAWKSHLQSSGCKTFQHSKVDLLELPEQVHTITIPDSWWPVE